MLTGIDPKNKPLPGPGKTAPRLLVDLQEYDPFSKAGTNTLSDAPPRFDETRPRNSVDRHKHVFTRRDDQSKLAQYTPVDAGGSYHVVAVCEGCRMHVEVKVNPDGDVPEDSLPCPNEGSPLHHFRYDPDRSRPVNFVRYKTYPNDPHEDLRVFTCSGIGCPVLVSVKSIPSMITPELRDLLVDKTVLQNRMDWLKAHHANIFEQEGPGLYQPAFKVLDTLHSYIRHTLEDADARRIPVENKRFILSFGNDCDLIFQKMHFTKVNANDCALWDPPPKEVLGNPESQIVRDLCRMKDEVQILMDQCKAWPAAPVRRKVSRAEKDFKIILACDSYETAMGWKVDLTRPEHPNYAALGVTGDISDKLLFWAYERQRDCDPRNAPYYFHCLSDIANGRESEFLQVEVARLRSQGEFTTKDLENSYAALDITDPEATDDDLVIGRYRSYLADAPKQEIQMREHLTIIGKARGSKAIMEVAQRTISDAYSAYAWLGASQDLDDQFLLSLYESRVQDIPSDKATATEALRTIAEARKSHVLLSFLETGSVYDLEVPAAYARLGIEDQSVDDEVVITTYKVRLEDDPTRIQDLREAMQVIGKARESTVIKDYLQTGNANAVQTLGSADWPVGLENIGNTCYLNSLLQFYFTIKPLRDMVLNFDQYRESEIIEEVLQRKRVGGRKVSGKEIMTGKEFVSHLKILFQNLISSTASSVTPERGLAVLALGPKPQAEEEERRMSMTSEANCPIVNVESADDKMDVDEVSQPVIQEPDDGASESTLVNDPDELPPPYTENDYIMIDSDEKATRPDKENMPPKLDVITKPTETQRTPLQNIPTNLAPGAEITQNASLPQVPDRAPPPIPPRPERRDIELSPDIMFGRQQDVAECIGNVMFQIEAAIKPDKLDDNGEQIDIVKELFYGKTKQTLSFPNSSETRIKEELFSHLLVNVADGDRDIYSAIDSSFDIEQVDLEGREAKRYLSISQLPPILQIQVQRVQFDRQKGSTYKSNSHLEFPETLYMDRYVDTDDSTFRTMREDSWKWKEQLTVLLARKEKLTNTPAGVDVPMVLDATREWLDEVNLTEDWVDVNADIISALEEDATIARKELEAINEEIKTLESRIKQQFAGLRKYGYRVHSVFIHSGSTANHGHYWIYIWDFQKNIFRNYNDGYVKEVTNLSEVFARPETGSATPYFLVFVREDSCSEITEAVKRQIEPR